MGGGTMGGVVEHSTPYLTQVHLVDSPTLPDHAVSLWYLLSWGMTSRSWQEPVDDRFDPTGALPVGPVAGDRYISTATANGWTDTYIYEYYDGAWVEAIPLEGWTTYVLDENTYYTFTGAAWVKTPEVMDHIDLANLQGGSATETYHLTATEHGYVSGVNAQSVLTTASPALVALDLSAGPIRQPNNTWHQWERAAAGGVYINGITLNTDDEVQPGADFRVAGLETDDTPGDVVGVLVPVTGGAAGASQSWGVQIAGVDVLRAISQSDGAGSVRCSGLLRSGRDVVAASADTALAAGDSLDPLAPTMRILSTGGAVVSTATPFFDETNGTYRQRVRLMGRDAAATIELRDDSVTAGTKLKLTGAAAIVLALGNSIDFERDPDDDLWWETGRS